MDGAAGSDRTFAPIRAMDTWVTELSTLIDFFDPNNFRLSLTFWKNCFSDEEDEVAAVLDFSSPEEVLVLVPPCQAAEAEAASVWFSAALPLLPDTDVDPLSLITEEVGAAAFGDFGSYG